jgi:serine/threonine protein kinase
VIDFGIAKAIHQRLTEKTLYTSYRQIIGTPQYMSPEQAEFSDLDIDTRCIAWGTTKSAAQSAKASPPPHHVA